MNQVPELDSRDLYKKLVTKYLNGEIPESEVEDISTIDEQQPPEPIAAPPVTTPQVIAQLPPPTVEPQVVAQPQPLPTPQVEPQQVEVQVPQGQAPVPKIKSEPTINEQ